MEKYFKTALYGVLGIFLYFLLYSIEGLPFALMHVNPNSLPTVIKITYVVTYQIMMIAIMLLLYYNMFKKDIPDMKKNHKKYYKEVFKYYLIAFGIMLISIGIIILFKGSMATNEELIRESFKISPFYIYFSGIIFAPIVEEVVFRGCIRKIVPNKYLFIIISGLVFGFVHVFDYVKTASDFFYLIPYSSLGMAFAYAYYKTNNILTSMGLHFMHNGVLMSLQFIMLFL